MKKFIALTVLLITFFGLQTTFGQKKSGLKTEYIRQLEESKAESAEMVKEQRLLKKAEKEGKLAEESLTGNTDPDSFGKNVKFLGAAVSGVVFQHPTCNPADLAAEGIILEADDRCMTVSNLTANTTQEFFDIGRITFPARSADNVIYYIANHVRTYTLFNASPSPVTGRVTYSPTITIESVALNDPAAIDPASGLPMNGSFTTGIGSRSVSQAVLPGIPHFELDGYSRAANRGIAGAFWSEIGLPDSVINRIYRNPITIKLNLRVSSKLTDSGQFFYTMRFMGN